MKIGINTRFLIKGQLEGVGRYTREISRRLVELCPEDEFFFFFDRPYDPEFIFGPNVTPVVVPPPARHPLLWYAWFEYSLPAAMKKRGIDVLFSPDGFCSLSSGIPQVMVIHDLAFEHFEGHVDGLKKRFFRRYSPQYARKADQIVTVSEFSSRDIHERYGIPEDRIHVIYNGVDDRFHPVTEEVMEKVRKDLTASVPYFIYLGALHPRKNVVRLLKAFDKYRSASSAIGKLVVVGRKAWSNGEMERTYAGLEHRDDVIFTGHLDGDELIRTISSASALVYPSLFEGFGLPILEAMKCGVPVITSNLSSMPEVAGDAAILVDPYDVESISSGMRCIEDAERRRELVSKGLERVRMFTWDSAAVEVARVIRSL